MTVLLVLCGICGQQKDGMTVQAWLEIAGAKVTMKATLCTDCYNELFAKAASETGCGQE